jgi:hypothetical protein
MYILPELNGLRHEDASTSGSGKKVQSSPEASRSEGSERQGASPPLPGVETTTSSVTLERDSDGKFFYRVTNSRTGETIMEFPPEAVRTVSKGIEEYVQQHTRTAKLEAKA